MTLEQAITISEDFKVLINSKYQIEGIDYIVTQVKPNEISKDNYEVIVICEDINSKKNKEFGHFELNRFKKEAIAL